MKRAGDKRQGTLFILGPYLTPVWQAVDREFEEEGLSEVWVPQEGPPDCPGEENRMKTGLLGEVDQDAGRPGAWVPPPLAYRDWPSHASPFSLWVL